VSSCTGSSPLVTTGCYNLLPKRPRRATFSDCPSRQNSRETPPLWTRQTPPFWTRQTPPLWTSDISLYSPSRLSLTGSRQDFHLFRHLSLGKDTRLRSEDVAFNGTLTTPTPQRKICVGREIPQFPARRVSLSRPSPIPCNVAAVSRGRIPITVSSTCLHG
jgi:hypothetical protein